MGHPAGLPLATKPAFRAFLLFHFISFSSNGKRIKCPGRAAAAHLKQVQGKTGICFVRAMEEFGSFMC